MAAVAALAAVGALAAGPPGVTRASVSTSSVQGNQNSFQSSISSDGRYVAFASAASNLVSGDVNGAGDVFVRDRLTGATELASAVSGAGGANPVNPGDQGNDYSWRPAISGDGRYVAYESAASTLVAGDTNGYNDVFLRDRTTGATTRVSVSSLGAQANDHSFSPAISADGRYVAFGSFATTLAPGDTNRVSDVYLRDRAAGLTERVSVGVGGVEGNGASGAAALSADGRFVAFLSAASNLVPGDTNGVVDVFVRDRTLGTTERVSVDSGGAEGNGPASSPTISADGRYVGFASGATNLVPGDTNGALDVFVRDRTAGTTERASVTGAGAQLNDDSFSPSLAGDGNVVVFASAATNAVAGDTNASTDVFARDRAAGTTERLSVDSGGSQANGASIVILVGEMASVVSGDGRYVSFISDASNLVPDDTAGVTDVFVADRSPGSTPNPETQILTGPPPTTTDQTAPFTWSTLPAGLRTECSLDGAAFAPCSSPRTYHGLDAGVHTFRVRAVNGDKRDPTPASWTWQIVGPGAPETTLTATPPASTSSREATLDWTSDQGGVRYQCSLDAAPFAACSPPRVYHGLPLGTHHFEVYAVNFAGQADPTPATADWTITP